MDSHRATATQKVMATSTVANFESRTCSGEKARIAAEASPATGPNTVFAAA